MSPERTIHEGGTTHSRSGVEVTQRERTLVTPWWVRLASETSLSPGWLLIAFPAVLYPLYLGLEALFGRGLAAATDFADIFEVRLPLTTTTMLGYIAMMYTYAARGTFRDLEALRPVLQGDGGTYAELRQQLIRFERRRLWIGGLIGFAFGCVLWEIAAGPWVERLRAGEWSLRSAWNILVFSAFWITAGRGTVYLIDSARLYSRIGERHVAVDLLDLGPLSPVRPENSCWRRRAPPDRSRQANEAQRSFRDRRSASPVIGGAIIQRRCQRTRYLRCDPRHPPTAHRTRVRGTRSSRLRQPLARSAGTDRRPRGSQRPRRPPAAAQVAAQGSPSPRTGGSASCGNGSSSS